MCNFEDEGDMPYLSEASKSVDELRRADESINHRYLTGSIRMEQGIA